MTKASLIKIVLNEVFRMRSVERRTEPDLVMQDPAKVKAYVDAGRELGVMKPVYLLHAAQISEVLKPGDTAVDLACGPATLLCMVAGLNPKVHFIGIDLSEEMLGYAREYAAACGLKNVEFRCCDITNLTCLADASVDAVFSTLALHHLPDETCLEKVFAETARILKPEGGVYLLDFGMLKTETAIREFAWQYANHQPEIFTLDYYYSLRAAFRVDTYRALARKHLAGRAVVYTSSPVAYNVAVKSCTRNAFDAELIAALSRYAGRLTDGQKEDLLGLILFLRMGGLKSRLLEAAIAEVRSSGADRVGDTLEVQVLES